MCADERQWVPPGGQRWTTLAGLAAAGHRSDIRAVEPGLTGIGADPPVAIGQRSLLVSTAQGNLLWDPSGFIDDAELPVRLWSGVLEVLPGVTLVQCGGHFPGSAVLHWAAGAGGRGVLLSGDTIFVTPGEDRVTFVWSAPNRLPLSAAAVRGVASAVEPYRFDRIYGGWWTPVLRSGAWETVRSSALRYIEHLEGVA